MSLRARFIAYLAGIHLLMAVVAGWLVARNRLWLIGAELVLLGSLLIGLTLVRRFFSSIQFVPDSARLLEDSDFMSRVREIGQPDIDRLIRVYNRMIDSLRAERVRLQEQHQFLALVLQESPAAIVVLDLDRRVSLVNPAAERLLQSPGGAILGQPLRALDRPAAAALAGLVEGERRVVTLWGGRRLRIWHGTFLDRSFRRSFYLLEELTDELRQSEKAAYEKLIRMLSHEVNNTVGASNSLLNSCLRYAGQLAPYDRADFEHALGVVIARTDQLNRFMRSFADVVRLPAPRLVPEEPAELVDDILRLVQPQVVERRVRVVREGATAIGPVLMDRTQMETLVQEILTGHRFPFALERLPTGVTRFTAVLAEPGLPPYAERMG